MQKIWCSMYMQSAYAYELFDLDSREANAQKEFFLSHAKGCKHVLDVGAGSGTVAFNLARYHIPVVCLEPSSAMRGLLVSRLAYNAELRGYITPLPYNANDFGLSQNFPLIYATNVLHLIVSESERAMILSNIVNHLETEGEAIIDFRIGALSVKDKEFSGEVKLGDVRYRRYTTIWQKDENEWLYRWLFEVSDCDRQIESFQEEFLVRTDTAETCRRLFEQNGLCIEAEYSDYRGTKFEADEKANRLIIVGRLV